MYNFSGIWFRIFGVCGSFFVLGIVLILFEKPWEVGFSLRKSKLGLISIAVSFCLGLFYLSCIVSPKISSYNGKFLNSHRAPREAPPLPVTDEYIFWNGEGKKHSFYLDIFSKKEIFPSEFQFGQEYTIYFDTNTYVIVKVDMKE